MLGQPAVTTEDQAQEVLIRWLRDQGYKGEIHISYSYGQKYSVIQGKNCYEFDVAKPYGVFFVYEDGVVKALSGIFQND